MKPYAFQVRAIEAARESMNRGRRVLITSPPGSGKTVMLSEIARRVYRAGGRTLIIAQRREILEQTFLHLGELGVRSNLVGGVYPDPHPDEDDSRPIQIASMMTLLRRGVRPAADVVLLDEAHHAPAEGHATVLRDYRNSLFAGLTATPIRLDGRGLGDLFDELVVAALPSQLIKVGLLAKPDPHTAPEDFLPNLTRCRRAMGDYVPSALEERVDRSELNGNVIHHYQWRANGKTAIVFAAGVRHSQHLVERFLQAGVAAEHLDGSMARDQRDAIVNRLRTGETLVVSNVGILHEGFDLPRTYAVILARPTKSLALYLQQTGRALRTYGDEVPIVLDHARNFTEHGAPEADRNFVLRGTIEERGGAPPIRSCPNCGAVVAMHVQQCPDCGLQLVRPREDPIENEDRRLRKITKQHREEFKRRIDAFLEEEGKDTQQWQGWRDQLVEIWTAERSL